MAFKDLFIKSDTPSNDGNVSEVVSATPTQSAPQPQSTPVNQTSGTVYNPTSSPIAADENIINALWQALINENRPGPDYLELKNNVEALGNLPISNEQKLQGAFNVLKHNYPNFSKDDVTKAIDYYINILNGEKERAYKELDEYKTKSIDGTEKEITSLTEKAAELKKQYDEVNALIQNKTIELAQSKSDIEMKTKTFNSSFDAVMSVLQSDKNNISNINFV